MLSSSPFESFFNDFADEAVTIRTLQRAEKRKIAAEWDESKRYPRKLKKSTRKHLTLRAKIASYDLFPDLTDDDIRDCASFMNKILARGGTTCR